jgi:hypothetical protein
MEVDGFPGLPGNTTAVAGGEPRNAMRSCTTCSKAKAKCVKRPGGAVCERYVFHVIKIIHGGCESNAQADVCTDVSV